jgi:hypothetical protein
VQVSATSHAPTDGRQTVLEGAKASAGQAVVTPSQVSATSQAPADARHTVVAGATASAGQAAVVPSQVSGTSQAPADGRHTVVDGANVSAGQVAELPVQVAPFPHGPDGPRHCVLAATNVHVAEQQEPAVPFAAPLSHCSEPATTPSPHTTATQVGWLPLLDAKPLGQLHVHTPGLLDVQVPPLPHGSGVPGHIEMHEVPLETKPASQVHV